MGNISNTTAQPRQLHTEWGNTSCMDHEFFMGLCCPGAE